MDVSEERVGIAAAAAVSRALEDAVRLGSLGLRGCEITDEVLAELQPGLRGLVALDIGSNPLTPASGPVLEALLRGKLRFLSVANTELGDAVAKQLDRSYTCANRLQ